MDQLLIFVSIPEVLYTLVMILLGSLIFIVGRKNLKAYHSEVHKQLPRGAALDDPVVEAAVDKQEQQDSALRRGYRRFRVLQIRFRVAFQIIFVCVWLCLIAIPFLGTVPAAYLSFFLAVASVLVGIAARPFLENVICGYVLMLGKAFKIGDTIIVDGNYGTIERISVTHTTIKVWDWRCYVVPNSGMLTKEIMNYTLDDSWVWAHVEFFVAVESDLDLVEQLARQSMAESENIESKEPPTFWVMDIEKEGVRLWIAGWASSPRGAWMLQHDTRRNLCRLFKENGIRTHLHRIESYANQSMKVAN